MATDWVDLLRRHDDVASVSALVEAGLSRQLIARRVRSGRWQRPLPRVVIGHSGPLSQRQRHRAALVYGGTDAALSHYSAAVLLGLRVHETDVHVTVRHGRGRQGAGFVVVHQSQAMIHAVRAEGLRCVNSPRTVVDVACDLRSLDDVRALIADSVQRGIASIDQLRHEADKAPTRGSRFLRIALQEAATGVRSAGEAEFLRLVRRARLPRPVLNAPINIAGRRFVVDALWPEHWLIVEIDGLTWHLDSASWELDLRRQNLLHSAGYLVLRFPVRRVREDPGGIIAELTAVLDVRSAS
jgi:very-short-patch-repair endonuclease